jgi:hypothetical protein
VADHPRDPHPDRLTWETASFDHNRAHWLVIDQLGSRPDEATSMTDLNVMRGPDPLPLFERPEQPGRVDLAHTGNTIQATTKGVAPFTLLLSPDKFDFNQPVKVIANGRTVFEGRVQRDLRTLMKLGGARQRSHDALRGDPMDGRFQEI